MLRRPCWVLLRRGQRAFAAVANPVLVDSGGLRIAAARSTVPTDSIRAAFYEALQAVAGTLRWGFDPARGITDGEEARRLLLCFASGFNGTRAARPGESALPLPWEPSPMGVRPRLPLLGACVSDFTSGTGQLSPFVQLVGIETTDPATELRPFVSAGGAIPPFSDYGQLLQRDSHFLLFAHPDASAKNLRGVIDRISALFPAAVVAGAVATLPRYPGLYGTAAAFEAAAAAGASGPLLHGGKGVPLGAPPATGAAVADGGAGSSSNSSGGSIDSGDVHHPLSGSAIGVAATAGPTASASPLPVIQLQPLFSNVVSIPAPPQNTRGHRAGTGTTLRARFAANRITTVTGPAAAGFQHLPPLPGPVQLVHVEDKDGRPLGVGLKSLPEQASAIASAAATSEVAPSGAAASSSSPAGASEATAASADDTSTAAGVSPDLALVVEPAHLQRKVTDAAVQAQEETRDPLSVVKRGDTLAYETKAEEEAADEAAAAARATAGAVEEAAPAGASTSSVAAPAPASPPPPPPPGAPILGLAVVGPKRPATKTSSGNGPTPAPLAQSIHALIAATFGDVEFSTYPGILTDASTQKQLLKVESAPVVAGAAAAARGTRPIEFSSAGDTAPDRPPKLAALLNASSTMGPDTPLSSPVPLFLLDRVAFPSYSLQFHIFEPRYRHMLRQYLRVAGDAAAPNPSGRALTTAEALAGGFDIAVGLPPPVRVSSYYDLMRAGNGSDAAGETAAATTPTVLQGVRAPVPLAATRIIDGSSTRAAAGYEETDGSGGSASNSRRLTAATAAATRALTTITLCRVRSLETVDPDGRAVGELRGHKRLRLHSAWVSPCSFGLVYGCGVPVEDVDGNAATAASVVASNAELYPLAGVTREAVSAAAAQETERRNLLAQAAEQADRLRRLWTHDSPAVLKFRRRWAAWTDAKTRPKGFEPLMSQYLHLGGPLTWMDDQGGALLPDKDSTSPEDLSWWLAFQAPLPEGDRQRLLDTTSTADRLQALHAWLEKQIAGHHDATR